MISINDAKQFVTDKKELYDAMVRNQYHLPDLKSQLCTQELMVETKN